MKAIIYEKYGNADVVKYTDINKPEIDDDSILVKVQAASINAMDMHLLQGTPFPLRFVTGLFKPKCKVLGSDFSGVIEKIGKNIDSYKVKEEVFGTCLMKQDGAFAEYTVIQKNQIARKPENISFSEAASVPIAGLTALQALTQAGVKERTNVLIYGASGGVGTFAIQIAKAMKANVTAVCSTRNTTVAKESGADIVIDYKKENWYDQDKTYDAILNVNGYTDLRIYRDKMVENGIFISISGTTKQILQMYFLKPFMRKKGNKKFLGFLTKVSKKDLDTLSEMLQKGEIKPHIDKEYLLQDAELALDHFIQGNTIGKTIIMME